MSQRDGKLDEKMLDALSCPMCHGIVKLKEKDNFVNNTLICVKCGKEYELKNGVPFMLVNKEQEEAQ